MTESWIEPYIASLIDNHSSIVVSIGKRDSNKIGYFVQIECRIKLRFRETMEVVTEYLNETDTDFRTVKKEQQQYGGYEVIIGRRNEIQATLNKIRPYTISRADAISTLCDVIIPMINEGAQKDRDTFIRLVKKIEQFREQAGRANRSKYDLEYFQQKWDVESSN